MATTSSPDCVLELHPYICLHLVPLQFLQTDESIPLPHLEVNMNNLVMRLVEIKG